MSRISVIVPVYKVEKYIHRCVNSILAQTFTDFELILVDDGSPDNCPEICDEYAKKDSRILVIHKANEGVSSARNTGLDWVFANSDSEWISFVDSDDWIHKDYLEILLTAVMTTGANISACSYDEKMTYESSETHPTNAVELISPEDFYCEKRTTSIVPWGKLYRKACYSTLRYPVGKIHEDEFTTYRLLFPEEKIAFCSSALYFYYKNPESITNSIWMPNRLDAIEAIEQQRDYFIKYGFENACKKATMSLLNTLASNLQIVEKIKEHKAFRRNLRKKLRNNLSVHKDTLNLTKQSSSWLYESAYPRLMVLYWYLQVVFSKLRIKR